MAKAPVRRNAPHITVIDGQPTTTSRDIAETFGKRHDHVLERIRKLDCSPEFRAPNFRETFREVPGPNGAVRKETEFRITRDGFAFLCMGFTGAKAAQWKEKYINTFNRMADKLVQRQPVPAKLTVALPQPDIDVRALMLSGQAEPVPLTPEHQDIINQHAWQLAGEAYALARQHLERRVAYSTTARQRSESASNAVKQVVQSVTLGNALAHRSHHTLRSHLQLAEAFEQMVQEQTTNIRALLGKAAPTQSEPS